MTYRATLHRPEAEQPQPLATLFLASGAGAVATVVANVVVLAASVDVASVRELKLLEAILGRPGWPRSQFLAWALPPILSKPLGLTSLATLLIFVALGIAAALLVFWTVAVLLVPVVMGARWVLRGQDQQFCSWFWGAAYPLGVLVAFSLPAIRSAIPEVVRNVQSLTESAIAIALGALVWFALLRVLRHPGRIRRFIWVAFAISLVVSITTWSGAAVAAAFAGSGRAQRSAAPGLPNLLLVSIDSLRRDHLHCYGYRRETSPTIDGLAREGVRFRTVVSPTSWTLPAHLTLLTSLPPEEHGVVDDDTRLREDALFLSEVLWEAGYTTAGFVSGPYLSGAYGFAKGWDLYDDYTVANVSHFDAWRGTTSPALLRVVSQWLSGWDKNGRQRPFFIFLHMWDVHYDYTPPPPYDSMFDPDYKGTVTGENYELGTQVHLGMNPRDLEHVIALYDGEIGYTDLYLGKVLDAVKALGVFDNTVIVVTADHGDEFFEHGRKGHKQALYDETLLVPLVMRFPAKVPHGKVIDSQVRLMDIAPTILSLAGVARPPRFGTSVPKGTDAPQDLTPWMIADARSSLPELVAFGDLVGEAPVPIASIRTARFKYIKEVRGRDGEELYNLAADAGEQTNLIGSDGVPAVALRQELAAWRAGWQNRRTLSEKVELPDELRERLRALGYVK